MSGLLRTVGSLARRFPGLAALAFAILLLPATAVGIDIYDAAALIPTPLLPDDTWRWVSAAWMTLPVALLVGAVFGRLRLGRRKLLALTTLAAWCGGVLAAVVAPDLFSLVGGHVGLAYVCMLDSCGMLAGPHTAPGSALDTFGLMMGLLLTATFATPVGWLFSVGSLPAVILGVNLWVRLLRGRPPLPVPAKPSVTGARIGTLQAQVVVPGRNHDPLYFEIVHAAGETEYRETPSRRSQELSGLDAGPVQVRVRVQAGERCGGWSEPADAVVPGWDPRPSMR